MTTLFAYRATEDGLRKRKLKRKIETPTPQRDRVIALAKRWMRAKEDRRYQHLRAADAERWRQLVEMSPGGVPIVPYTNSIDMVERVAVWHGLTRSALIRMDRREHVVEARFDAIAAVFINCRINGRPPSLLDLGRSFGKRDHTTIINALRQRGITAWT